MRKKDQKRKQTIIENLDDEAEKKVCKTAKKRLKKNTRNITDEAKEKLHSSYQKKESRPFMKILMMKQKGNCVKVIKKANNS